MDGDARERPAPDQLDTARYIAALSAELSSMARHADMDLLAYFLEMARMEATACVKSSKRSSRRLRAAPERLDAQRGARAAKRDAS